MDPYKVYLRDEKYYSTPGKDYKLCVGDYVVVDCLDWFYYGKVTEVIEKENFVRVYRCDVVAGVGGGKARSMGNLTWDSLDLLIGRERILVRKREIVI